MCLFVGYLFVADSVFCQIGTEKNFLSKVERYDNNYDINTNGYVSVSVDSSRNDSLRTMEIQGIAGIPTDKDNTDAFAKLVLVGDRESYVIDAYLGFSGDINGQFATTGIKGSTHKFKSEFSSIPIKNGTYRLYVYYYENDESNGLLNTYKMYEKSSSGISEYVPQRINNISYQDSNEVFAYFFGKENCSDGKYYKISGIAANKNYDSAGEKVYLQFTFDDGSIVTYDTVVSRSWWTINNLDKKYQESSFYAKIPTKVLNGKHVKMRILVDNNGIYAYNKTFHLSFDDLGYRIMAPEEIYVGKVKNFGTFETDICVTGEMTNAFLENDSKDAYIFEGISYVEGLISKNSKAYLEFNFADGTIATYPAELSVNNEIAGDYSNSAFRAEIVKSAFGKQDVSVYMIIENDGKMFRTADGIEYGYSDGTFVKK